MNKLVVFTFSIFFVISCGTSSGESTEPTPPGKLPFVSLKDFSYKGAFKVDTGAFGESDSKYAMPFIAVTDSLTSFFMAGRATDMAIAEFVMPSLTLSENLDDLKVADKTVQDYSKFLDRVPSGNPDNIDRISGIFLSDHGLIVNTTEYYDALADNTDTTFLISDSDNLGGSDVSGFFSLEGYAQAAGWISKIPPEWQQTLGGQYITGWASNLPIASRNSFGPSAFVVDLDSFPPSLSLGAEIPTTELLNFPAGTALHLDKYNNNFTERRDNLNEDTQPIVVGDNDLWTVISWAVYGFIIPDTRTYAVFGTSGGHESGIGYKITQTTGLKCSGPCANDPDDYYNYYWLFDVEDLVAVKAGKKLSSEIKPYEYGVFPAPFQSEVSVQEQSHSHYRPIRGGDYHASSKTLYLVLGGPGWTELVVIAYDIRLLKPKAPDLYLKE